MPDFHMHNIINIIITIHISSDQKQLTAASHAVPIDVAAVVVNGSCVVISTEDMNKSEEANPKKRKIK